MLAGLCVCVFCLSMKAQDFDCSSVSKIKPESENCIVKNRKQGQLTKFVSVLNWCYSIEYQLGVLLNAFNPPPPRYINNEHSLNTFLMDIKYILTRKRGCSGLNTHTSPMSTLMIIAIQRCQLNSPLTEDEQLQLLINSGDVVVVSMIQRSLCQKNKSQRNPRTFMVKYWSLSGEI